jgi:hypothetical protein
MKILGAVLELPTKQHCQSSPFTSNFLIFSIALGADHSFYVKIFETHARAFLTLNIFAIGRVVWHGTFLEREQIDKLEYFT